MACEILFAYVKEKGVVKMKLQGWAIVALSISHKYLYEDKTKFVWCGGINNAECCYITSQAYSVEEICAIEMDMLMFIQVDFKRYIPYWAREVEKTALGWCDSLTESTLASTTIYKSLRRLYVER
jgi:hypothetical protein